MSEVIRIGVTAVDGHSISYVDVVTRMSGVVDRGEHHFGVGDEALVEIDRSRAVPVIVRIVGGPVVVVGSGFDDDPPDEPGPACRREAIPGRPGCGSDGVTSRPDPDG